MRSLVRTLALLAFLVAAAPAHAQPPALSALRLSAGVDAQGAILEDASGRHSAFLPGAYATYSVTSTMAAAATVQRDFASEQTFGRVGLRFLLAGFERAQLAAGVDMIACDEVPGLEDPTSWEVGVFGSYPAIQDEIGRTTVWGVISARFDPENDRQTYLVGLRAQLLGGKP